MSQQLLSSTSSSKCPDIIGRGRCHHRTILVALVSISMTTCCFLGTKVHCAHGGDALDLASIIQRNNYYNRDDVPSSDMGHPTTVIIQMYIEGMSSFRAQTMDFQLDLYFQEKWIDKRLAHNGSKRILVKDFDSLNLIWHPDLYFANARESSFHHVTSPNFLVWIYPNGTVWYDISEFDGDLYAESGEVSFGLPILHPENSQLYLIIIFWSIILIVDAYDVEQMVIEWADNGGALAIQKNEEILMPDMRLRKISPSLKNETYATGIWSCARAEFVVDRELLHHIIQSYVPSSLIVIISWFSFWLDVESVPGRVSLSITTLLTLATQNSAERMTLPQASYVKASDVFGGACMAFVFSAMIEFTVVNYFTRRKPSRERRNSRKYTSSNRDVGTMDSNRFFDVAEPLMTMRSSTPSPNPNADQMLSDNTVKRNGGSGYRMVCLEDRITHVGNARRESFSALRRLPQSFLSTVSAGNKKYTNRRRKIEERMELNRKEAQSIDRKCRIYFPLAFLIFNIIYWIYYLIIATDEI